MLSWVHSLKIGIGLGNIYAKRANREFLGFLARHLAFGAFTGWSILAIFVVFDFGGLRTVAHLNHLEYLVYPLLAVFFAITFGSAFMGIGIMSQRETKSGGGKNKRENVETMAAILAPVRDRK